MKTSFLWTSLAVVSLLSACSGGGGKGIDASKNAALDVCEPATGPVGTTVVCTDKSITSDSTLFFGGKPVAFTLNEDGSASFPVPPSLPGEKQITVGQGDGDVTVLASFELTAPDSPDSDDVLPSTGGSGATGTTGGDIIEPSGTTGDGGTGGTTAGEGTTGGTTGGGSTGGASGGTGGETPPAASAEISTFTIQKVTGSAQLSTYKVTYAFKGKAAYVSGNLFNRKPGDDKLPAAQQCQLQDGNRYLVTNPDGTNLTGGSANFTKYEHLAEGILCNNTNGSTADDCKTSSSSSWLNEAPQYGGRFSDPMMKKDRYAYQPVYNYEVMKDITFEKVDNLEYKLVNDYWKYIELEKNPNCRLDLIKDGVLQDHGDFTTRSLSQYGRVCLAVQGEDGGWEVECKTVEAPVPSVSSSTVTVAADKPAFTLKLTYANAQSAGVSGCITKSGGTLSNGTGSYEGECAINSESKTVHVVLQGIGENNQKKKKYDVSLGTPSVSLKLYGAEPLSSGPSDIQLAYKATRTYAISDEDGEVASGSAGWFKQYSLSGFSSGNGTFTVSNPSDVEGVKSSPFDFSHNSWTFKAYDFDGNIYSATWGKSFAKDFSLLVSGGVNGGMDPYSFQHCNNTPNLVIYMDLPWSGHGISSLTSTNCDVNAGSSDLGDMGKYGGQSGHIYVSKSFGPKGDKWSHSLSCDFKIKYYDGDETIRSFTMTGVSCN